jgi:hypothetical protein
MNDDDLSNIYLGIWKLKLLKILRNNGAQWKNSQSWNPQDGRKPQRKCNPQNNRKLSVHRISRRKKKKSKL